MRPRSNTLAATLAAAFLALSLTPAFADPDPVVGTSSGQPVVLRPNLVTLPFEDLSIERSPGVRNLRFSNLIGNRGPGALELFPVADDCDGDGDPQDDRSAYQRVFADTDDDGIFRRGVDQPAFERFVGCMYFHPEHEHWHLEDVAHYVLTGPRGRRLVAESIKVSFCVRDSLSPWTLAGTPQEAYYGECTQDGTTGMSVGWADLYAADLAGQSLDIRGVAGGRYCLRSVADPSDQIDERRDDDNRRTLLIRIRGTTVTSLGTRC